MRLWRACDRNRCLQQPAFLVPASCLKLGSGKTDFDSEWVPFTDSPSKNGSEGTSLAVQWLRLHASTAGGVGSSLAGELRSLMPCSASKKNPNKTNKKDKTQNGSDLSLASLLPLKSRKNFCTLGLWMIKIQGFDTGEMIAQLVETLNSCVVLGKSLHYLRFSFLCVKWGCNIDDRSRVSVRAEWDNAPESAFIKEKKNYCVCLFLKWKTLY